MSQTLERSSTALATIVTLTAVQAYAPGGVDKLLDQIEADARAQTFDMAGIHGREACRSYAYKITRSKTALDDMGKELTEQWRKSTAAVNAERKIVRERLEVLADEVRAPLTVYEQEELARVDGHEHALAAIVAASGAGATAAALAERLTELRTMPARDWQEFAQRASDLLVAEIGRITGLHAATLAREADAAELAELRALRADRERGEAEREALRLQEARDADIARQAAEQERIRSERTAAVERQAAAAREQAAHTAAAEAVEQARQADANATLQAAEAVAAEQRRVEELRRKNEAEEVRRIANRRNRGRVNTAAKQALVAGGIAEDVAQRVIELIALGSIPRVSISY